MIFIYTSFISSHSSTATFHSSWFTKPCYWFIEDNDTQHIKRPTPVALETLLSFTQIEYISYTHVSSNEVLIIHFGYSIMFTTFSIDVAYINLKPLRKLGNNPIYSNHVNLAESRAQWKYLKSGCNLWRLSHPIK